MGRWADWFTLSLAGRRRAGEKIHSQFNKLMTRWKSRRPKDARLFGMIQAFEISQKMNTGILEPMKRKKP